MASSFYKSPFKTMYSTFLSQSVSTHTPFTPTLKRQPNTKIQYQVFTLGTLYAEKTFYLKTDSQGNAVPGLQDCKGISPLPRDGRFYPGIVQSLKDGGCEMLVSVDYQRNDVARLKLVLLSLYSNFRVFRTKGISPSKMCIMLFCDGIKDLQETFTASEDDRLFLQQFIDISAVSEKFNTGPIEPIIKRELGSGSNLDPEVAHCFQSYMITDESESEPVQLVCVVKHFCRKKLNSRMWFYKGFCETIQPKFCAILNAGTLPEHESIWNMYCAFTPEVGIVVGEVLPHAFDQFSLFQAALAYRQTTALKLDRFIESCAGVPCSSNYSLVAFRLEAIKGIPLKQCVIDLYCPTRHSPYNINKYNCGDCLLALATVTRKGSVYSLRYEKDAKASVPLPNDLVGYMQLRKAATRTELFMFFESVRRWKKSTPSVNPLKKYFLGFLILYFCLKFCAIWCASALTIVILNFPVIEFFTSVGLGFIGHYLGTVYCILVFLVLVLSLSNQTFKFLMAYRLLVTFFTVHFMLAVFSFCYCYVVLGLFYNEGVLLGVWLVSFLLSSALTQDLIRLPWLCLQHFLMIPTENNLLTVSLFSSLHNFYYSDWLSKAVSHRFTVSEEFHLFRTYITITWAFTNWLIFLLMKRGNIELEGVLVSSRDCWYGMLSILVGLDIAKLLIATRHLFVKKKKVQASNGFFVVEPAKSVIIEDSSGEVVAEQPEPGIDLMNSSSSQTDSVEENQSSNSELSLSIQSIDVAGRYTEADWHMRNFSEISNVPRGPDSHFVSSSCSIRGL
mmetsp:Transcript_7576/g.14173  ORF Transcript_7576/g.14173 Transcript_7576/m.14173 type:complete len:786 (+) Transcript_7576:136-2493(+)